MAPLVLDSFNFDPALKESKWKDQDLEVLNYLIKIAEVERDQYFNDLYEAVANIELNLKLGIGNILIKDYKTYRLINEEKGVGIATSYVPLPTLIKHFGLENI